MERKREYSAEFAETARGFKHLIVHVAFNVSRDKIVPWRGCARFVRWPFPAKIGHDSPAAA
jgi:hypothetical protein